MRLPRWIIIALSRTAQLLTVCVVSAAPAQPPVLSQVDMTMFHPSSVQVRGVSGDGVWLLGNCRLPGSGWTRVFRWSAQTGVQVLGLPPGVSENSAVTAAVINRDGTHIALNSLTNGHSYIWSSVTGGFTDLGLLPNATTASVRGISDDGGVVIGEDGSPPTGWRWTLQGGMSLLPQPPGTSGATSPTDISGDGLVIAGVVWNPTLSSRVVCRWYSDGTSEQLGRPPMPFGEAWNPQQVRLNTDGSVMISESPSCRWTRETGFKVLSDAYFREVSGDGSLIAGGANVFVGTGLDRFVINDVLTAAGAARPVFPFIIQSVLGISDDASVLIGLALRPGGPQTGANVYRVERFPRYCAEFAADPMPVTVCSRSGAVAHFNVEVARWLGTIEVSTDYQWEWRLAGASCDWMELRSALNLDCIDFLDGMEATGQRTQSLSLTVLGQRPDLGVLEVRCRISSACGVRYSKPAQLFMASADVGVQGGLPGGDGVYDNNDFIVFINRFFSRRVEADLGSQGGELGSDGLHDNNDFIVFIDLFFAGC